MSKFFKFATVLLLSLGVSSALAKPISEDKIPQSLLPWVDWVKHSHPELDCPMRYSNQQRDCVWPGELEIRASKSGAKFQQKLTVYKQSEIRLPGDRNNWPVNVKANNEVLVVVERNGAPYVMFNPGNYQVSGEFSWRSLPASLAIDSGVGITTWMLLGFGLSQVSVFALVLVAAWFFAMYFRIKAGENPGFEKHWFNLLQILLAVLTVITAVVLLGAVQNGLLGQPAMLIQGNNSSSYLFNWYQDRVSSQYPQATVLSMPLWVYRALMMAWALWLAFSLLSWIKWGWQAYSTGGLWRKVSLKINRPHFGGNKDKPQDSKSEVENS